jgi:hypothetical protein
MPNLKRNFIKGRMNKSVDERLVRDGEYIDAMNVRLGSTEETEIGSVENSKGNLLATPALISFNGYELSTSARCIGAYEDGVNETLYWFVTDSDFNTSGASTGKLDLILSFNIQTNVVTYHVISINDGGGVNTTLNFNSKYLITGVDLIDDMLFFTDDLNPPRKINVTKSYPAPATAGSTDDANLAEDILVIKAPPVAAPTFTLFDSGSQDNFLERRFICFAYRYRYEDNEYSATSQFSDVAFSSKQFDLDISNFLNGGMLNVFNTAEVTYNTGGPLVKGIDLLFKEADNTTIRVIEKIEKFENGVQVISDNIDQTFEFDNSRIYTVLPSSEILRLYDNVPRFAKAQSIMGNRLMYGNYVDGYNLIDKNGNDLRLDYLTELHTNTVEFTSIPSASIVKNSFTYGAGAGGATIGNAKLEVDLSGLSLTAGSTLTVSITFTHNSFGGPGAAPTAKTTNQTITLSFNLQQDYTSVQAMVDSSEFKSAIGYNNIDTLANACTASSLSDNMRCVLPSALDSYVKTETGLNGFSPYPNSEGMWQATASGSNVLNIALLASLYVNGSVNIFEYYKIVTATASFFNTDTAKSLHSDRDYEVGIVYMDEFNRATTALVSDETNTIHVPCDNSDLQNQVKVTLDPTMIAPAWAKRYKWVMKQDKDTYETILSQFIVKDPNSNYVWFLLEGENANKVAVGDKLKVKTDTNGAVNTCAWTTVLDKQAQPENFLMPSGGTGPLSTAGVYMKLNPTNFAAIVSTATSAVDFGLEESDQVGCLGAASDTHPFLNYIVNQLDPITGNYVDVDVPAGSRIEVFIEFRRNGTGNQCEGQVYTIDQTFVSTATYNNIAEWWAGDNIDITTGTSQVIPSGAGNPNTNEYVSPYPSIANLASISIGITPVQPSRNLYRFGRHITGTSNELVLELRGGTATCCGISPNRRSSIQCHIKLFKASEVFVFETEAKDTSPDIFYEGAMSYPIDANGFHLTTNPSEPNNVNQDATTAGVAYLDFFNCFSFGNGVESYKIEDSLVGKSFALGNRVTAVAAQDYKEADRFADITYSGIVNDVSNVNKLNEFNLGLANYKALEDTYGSVEILHARKTDLLVLQEDRISFVQVGKNLLSDAVGGGAVTSVPEVLGQQIARPEEYGISHNPESFAVYGYDKYFTDAKRGAVLQLRGTSGPNENLIVISEAGMRSWFRDLFNTSFNTQKLGGYDPYMNEFVLSSNNTLLPVVEECIPCGREEQISVQSGAPYTFCVDVSGNVGDVVLSYNITGSANISVTYNSVTTTTGDVTGSGTFTFSKDVVNVNTASITITAVDGNASLSLAIPCPTIKEMEIVKIVLTSNVNANESIHNQFRYTAGTYTSRTTSSGMIFKSGSATPIVSEYTRLKGNQGDGIIPTDGSTVTMISSKQGFDNFVFDTNNSKFRYLRSNTLYDGGSLADMTTMIAASTQALPLVTTRAPQQYSADFTMPAGTETYLYLIYDYRDIYQWGLCFDASVVLDVCCNCTHNWYLVRNSADAEEEYFAQSAVALVIGTHYKLRGLGDKCFEVISTTTTRPTQTIDVACTP